MLNHICVAGRLVRDPELRTTQSGLSTCTITLACDRGDKEKHTDFIDVVCWRQTAEFVSKYFSKGRMAIVDGRLQIREWTDKDGNKRRSAEVVASSVYFGDSRASTSDSKSGGSSNTPDTNSTAQARDYAAEYTSEYGRYTNQPSGFAEISDEDGELPF